MPNLALARNALRSEIAFLEREQSRLQGVLDQLGGDVATEPLKKRGRKSAADKVAASQAAVAKAMELIRSTGKAGMNAIKLAHELRKAGHGKVGKADLLSDKTIKMTGKGGGSTYAFRG